MAGLKRRAKAHHTGRSKGKPDYVPPRAYTPGLANVPWRQMTWRERFETGSVSADENKGKITL